MPGSDQLRGSIMALPAGGRPPGVSLREDPLVLAGRDSARVYRYEAAVAGQWRANWQRLALYLSSLPAPHLDVPESPGPAPVDPESGSDVGGDIAAIICSYGWDCRQALGVVYGNWRCPNGESGGDPNAEYNGNYGLFQINASAHGEEPSMLKDPAYNVAVAYRIWLDQGWAPWSCRP